MQLPQGTQGPKQKVRHRGVCNEWHRLSHGVSQQGVYEPPAIVFLRLAGIVFHVILVTVVVVVVVVAVVVVVVVVVGVVVVVAVAIY